MNAHTTFEQSTQNALFTLADIETSADSEPRIKDVLLADRLGYRRSRTIRELIERNRDELQAYGDIAVRHGAVEVGNGTIKEVNEFHLNEHQSLLLCMFSKTELAAVVRKALIEVFVAYRRSHLVQGRALEAEPAFNEQIQSLDSLKLRKVTLCHRLFGERAGQQMWRKVDLEWVPAMAPAFVQGDIFDGPPPGSVTITVTPQDMRQAA